MTLIAAADLLSRPTPVRLVDARPGRATFLSGHLKGAVHADLERDLSTAEDPGHDPARGGRHPLPPVARFAAALGRWGITPATDVVVYDASGGGNAAARFWWMLRALGHARVSLLDGGLAAAQAAGLPLTQEPSPVPPAPAYPADRWLLPLADARTVETRRLDPAWKVVDVRTADRWRGEAEPYDPLPGRIPGTVNLPWSEALGPDGRYLPAEELLRRFQTVLGGTPADHLVLHCGSGVTACQTLLAMEVAGLAGAAIYMGSWSEWCRSQRAKAGAAVEGALRR